MGWGGGMVVQLISLSSPSRFEVELGCGCGWAVTIYCFNDFPSVSYVKNRKKMILDVQANFPKRVFVQWPRECRVFNLQNNKSLQFGWR